VEINIQVGFVSGFGILLASAQVLFLLAVYTPWSRVNYGFGLSKHLGPERFLNVSILWNHCNRINGWRQTNQDWSTKDAGSRSPMFTRKWSILKPTTSVHIQTKGIYDTAKDHDRKPHIFAAPNCTVFTSNVRKLTNTSMPVWANWGSRMILVRSPESPKKKKEGNHNEISMGTAGGGLLTHPRPFQYQNLVDILQRTHLEIGLIWKDPCRSTGSTLRFLGSVDRYQHIRDDWWTSCEKMELT